MSRSIGKLFSFFLAACCTILAAPASAQTIGINDVSAIMCELSPEGMVTFSLAGVAGGSWGVDLQVEQSGTVLYQSTTPPTPLSSDIADTSLGPFPLPTNGNPFRVTLTLLNGSSQPVYRSIADLTLNGTTCATENISITNEPILVPGPGTDTEIQPVPASSATGLLGLSLGIPLLAWYCRHRNSRKAAR